MTKDNWTKHSANLDSLRKWLAQQISDAVLRDDHEALRGISDAVGLTSQLSAKLASLATGTSADAEAVKLTPAPAAPVNGDYPRFRLEGRRLVMMGPSETGKEYEHVVSRQRYRQILDCLRSIAGASRDVTVDAVANKIGGPTYHIRAVLKFLKKRNLLISERKGQYRFIPRFTEDVNQAWPEATAN